ncbi:HAD-IIB family hydrolase [Desulfopila sp. IMCC35006]|uniref:HAD-IIB family hydrolase n=1 Tax=Desulfopila sp. IMCC35006 TaxID=2569542 RepID=UPI0010AD235E|nr:HAD-IIB family hydrolase [Desulfopila sp. IMCC35006]TKB26990.1 HAD-IIB family hydrolase [Desulfopila sp. IMCC35006]
MKPIDLFRRQQACTIQYVLTDIDDTLTHSGRIPACAYHALENLQKIGVQIIPITGRPAGWCDLIARMWPVAGVVGENGAFYFVYDAHHKKMVRRYARTEEERAQDRTTLSRVCTEILQAVPGSAVSADQHYREADLAIDFCEDVSRLSNDDIAKIVEVFQRNGASAKISSIHVNGWFGSYDKLSMTKLLFAERFGLVLDDIKKTVVYAGDSPNDEPMFAYFPHSVGVANVLQFQEILVHTPTWITAAEGGYGFAELANHLQRAISPSQ